MDMDDYYVVSDEYKIKLDSHPTFRIFLDGKEVSLLLYACQGVGTSLSFGSKSLETFLCFLVQPSCTILPCVRG